MKFIADIHISPQTVKSLTDKGYKIKRVTEFLKPNAKDEEILERVLPQIESEINKGSIIIVEEERIRIRKLPIEV